MKEKKKIKRLRKREKQLEKELKKVRRKISRRLPRWTLSADFHDHFAEALRNRMATMFNPLCLPLDDFPEDSPILEED